MIHKNSSYRSSTLLSKLHLNNQTFFTKNEAMEALQFGTEGAVTELLNDMIRRGLLMRVKSGLYHIIPYDVDATTYIPNWHLVANSLIQEQTYYIGYNSAMQIHGLTTQPFYREQVVVAKQIRPAILKVKGVEFQFIYHNSQHFFGHQKIWVDDFHRLPVSSLEKTLIDCLYKPAYAGGILEIAKAIFKAKDQINFEIMKNYLTIFDAQVVSKRLGFILDTFEINHTFTEQIQTTLSNAYTLLDPDLPKLGKFTSKWKLQVNIDKETILNSVHT
jgi:predicted transcriptional regulator of viral defense system